jgi:hypothetical protein
MARRRYAMRAGLVAAGDAPYSRQEISPLHVLTLNMNVLDASLLKVFADSLNITAIARGARMLGKKVLGFPI